MAEQITCPFCQDENFEFREEGNERQKICKNCEKVVERTEIGKDEIKQD